MRPAALKLMGVALAAVLAVAFAMPVASAETFDECVQACIDQWEADRAACDEALAQALAERDEQAAQCFEDFANDPIGLGLCLRDVNIGRANDQRDYNRCISIANTTAYNCYRDCTVSPGQP